MDNESLFTISSNNSMHFAWYRDGKVSAGSSDDLSNKRNPYDYVLAKGYSTDDLIAISSNDSMHFAWYKDGMVSAGDSNSLGNKRNPYNFQLAPGYSIDDLVAISSNNAMHFAWYKDGKVSAGDSDNLASKRSPYAFVLAQGYSIDDLVAISSNDSMHFAWYNDEMVSAGDSDNLGNKRSPYKYSLATGYGAIDWLIEVIDIKFDTIKYPPQGTVTDEFYHQNFDNPTNASISQNIKSSLTKTSSFEFHMKQTLKIGASAKFSAQVPFIGSAETTISAELALEFGEKWTDTQSKTYEVNTSVNIPANTSIEALWLVDWNDDLKINYQMIVKVSAISGSVPLTSYQILALLQKQGFDGVVLDKSVPNELTVGLSGLFVGAYGMNSIVKTKALGKVIDSLHDKPL